MPYHEVDQLLVEGEFVDDVRVWPSQREVASRYGVAPSLVALFASQHECTRRRAEFRARGEVSEPAPIAEPVAPTPPTPSVEVAEVVPALPAVSLKSRRRPATSITRASLSMTRSLTTIASM
jgi:hypothetical protein